MASKGQLTPRMLQVLKEQTLRQVTAMRQKCSYLDFAPDDVTPAKLSAASACVAKRCDEFLACLESSNSM